METITTTYAGDSQEVGLTASTRLVAAGILCVLVCCVFMVIAISILKVKTADNNGKLQPKTQQQVSKSQIATRMDYNPPVDNIDMYIHNPNSNHDNKNNSNHADESLATARVEGGIGRSIGALNDGPKTQLKELKEEENERKSPPVRGGIRFRNLGKTLQVRHQTAFIF